MSLQSVERKRFQQTFIILQDRLNKLNLIAPYPGLNLRSLYSIWAVSQANLSHPHDLYIA